MFNKVADDVPSEQRTNQTVVSLLKCFRPPVPNDLLRTLLVLKCSALVFLEPEENWNDKADVMWNCLEICCMRNEIIIRWNDKNASCFEITQTVDILIECLHSKSDRFVFAFSHIVVFSLNQHIKNIKQLRMDRELS